MMKKVNEYPINSIKHLMLVSFFCILDDELKCIAKKIDDYYKKLCVIIVSMIFYALEST